MPVFRSPPSQVPFSPPVLPRLRALPAPAAVAGTLSTAIPAVGTVLASSGTAQRVNFVFAGSNLTVDAPVISPDAGSLGALTVDSATTCHGTYTPPASAQTITFTATSHSSSTAILSIMQAATNYTASGPAGGVQLVASTNFTVALPAARAVDVAVIVTPSDGGAGGTFTPSTVTLSVNTTAPSATFTYTPPSGVAPRTLSFVDNGGLTDPANLSYSVTTATTATLYPIVAAVINENSPTQTASGSSTIAVGQFGGTQKNRGLIYFDISSLGSDWTVTSAVLKLHVNTNFLGASHTLNIYRLKRMARRGQTNRATWNEYDSGSAWGTAGGSNASDRDTVAVGTLAVTSSTTGQVSITLDTASIQAWVDGSFEANGLILVASDESGTTLIRWDGYTAFPIANRPTLEIVYAPVVHALTDGILAYHKLDGGVLTDASGNNHTLTDHNGVTSVAGKLNTAGGFDHALSQYLSSSDAALKLGNVDWTWCGWAYLTDNLDFYTVVSIGDVSGVGGGFKLFYHKVSVLDNYVAQLYNDAVSTDVTLCDVVGVQGASPSTQAWHFLAVRHDHVRRWFHLFVDDFSPDSASSHAVGQAIGTGYGPYPLPSVENAPTAPATDYLIGGVRVGTVGQTFHGRLDELGFWSRWLSNTEVAAVKAAVVAGNSYPFTGGGGGGSSSSNTADLLLLGIL